MKKFGKLGLSLGILGALFIFFSMFTFIIEEDEVAVKKRLGKITDAYIDSPSDLDKVSSDLEKRNYGSINVSADKGLHFKVPFIDTVTKYSSKYITYISTTETINTKDKRKIDIQMFAQYKVLNPVFVNVTFAGRTSTVKSLVDDRVPPLIVQAGNSLNFPDFFKTDIVGPLISEKRDILNDELSLNYGIYVADLGIHRKNFPTSNIASIEDKMTEEILKQSEQLIAVGESEYKKSVAETDRFKAEKVAKARQEAAQIKADADKDALEIYQNSLSKDIAFYEFIKRMETYRNIKDTTIFLDSSNDFLKNINGYK
ncbi:MAG: SPFH domain-containing protein [Tissierellales bacterium]|jgi:membrane protease subunit HflC|nr:SPFH domain-containing protein [Tissierellales bacterium]